ncbi:DeoR/GlpR family DNA-binding transcription regulator [Sporosarcina sp. CAU 1771]
MFAAQRIEKIKEIMLEHQNVKNSLLIELLGVSGVTIRKDLDTLQNAGFLTKSFGGATLNTGENNTKGNNSSSQTDVYIEDIEVKEYIANLAFQHVEKGDTIFLGSGATCYLLSKKLKELKDITVVTNNVNALNELAPIISRVFFIGGEIVFQDGMISTGSEKVDEYFKDLYVNKAFTSAAGADLVAGITVNHAISTFTYRKIQDMASSWILLMEEEKFGRRGIYQIAPLNSPNCIITNKIPDEYRTVFEDIGTTVCTK